MGGLNLNLEPEQILDIADHAVRTTMHRKSCWWDEDREDVRQEAALAILLASRRGEDKDRGYYFGAARKGVYMWIRFWMHPRTNQTFQLLATVEDLVASKTAIGDAMLRHLNSLAPLLRGQRTKRRKTTEDEIALEVAYVRLMVEGYSLEEAAGELGRTKRNTDALRERVVPRLQMIADGKKPMACHAKPKPHQIAALRKLEQDPEALRRRNEAIGTAKRERDRRKASLHPKPSCDTLERMKL